MDETIVRVKRSEIAQCAARIKEWGYPQVFLTIQGDGEIKANWFFGRSDFVLKPGFIVLLECRQQTEEAIAYAIAIVIRNQEGYAVSAG